MNKTLLSFSIGPVQDFIAAARTTRDLWTGSYLLSWLTAHAMDVVLQAEGRVLRPSVEENHALLRAVRRHRECLSPDGMGYRPRPEKAEDSALLAGLPNTFVAAAADGVNAMELAERMKSAVRDEWRRIACAVRSTLSDQWRDSPGWDVRWQTQIDGFWDVRVVVLPGDVEDAAIRRLLQDPPNDPFQLRMQAIGKLAAADKLIRHFPPHETTTTNGDSSETGSQEPDDTRPKCSLLGTFAQMGPIARVNESQMSKTSEFWKSVCGKDIDGSRLGQRDRLCAVSLVKRLAWSAALAESLGRSKNDRHFSDIDTICAAEWLAGLDDHPQLEWNGRHTDCHKWSGHWLRWASITEADEDDEVKPDDQTFEKIRRAKSREIAGPPPTYYAVIQLDGDNMGEVVQDLDEKQLGEVSAKLARFAGESVPDAVRAALGTLVYAGGDDVLAFVPASRALSCANQLNQAFQSLKFPKLPATCSAAVVLAHYKAPLRLVLEAAREAEQLAKQSGKDCLAISVMKRSGEHSTAVIGWDQVPTLVSFENDFRNDVTDRWAYRFRQQLDDLPDDLAIWRAELKRLLEKAESLPDGLAQRVLKFWDRYQTFGTDPKRQSFFTSNSGRATWPLSFIQLVQAASFLARGGRD